MSQVFELKKGVVWRALTHMVLIGKDILVLPSTVTNVAEDGLYCNNLIKTIYYCGSTHLINYSQLMWQVNAPDIKVTSSYTHGTIFRDYTPKKDSSSISEAEEKCKSFAYKPEATATATEAPTATEANRGCTQAFGRLHPVLSLACFFSLSLSLSSSSSLSLIPDQLSHPFSLSLSLSLPRPNSASYSHSHSHSHSSISL